MHLKFANKVRKFRRKLCFQLRARCTLLGAVYLWQNKDNPNIWKKGEWCMIFYRYFLPAKKIHINVAGCVMDHTIFHLSQICNSSSCTLWCTNSSNLDCEWSFSNRYIASNERAYTKFLPKVKTLVERPTEAQPYTPSYASLPKGKPRRSKAPTQSFGMAENAYLVINFPDALIFILTGKLRKT